MSVITAVILGSLICGLLLVIAAGCGLRLYHLRVALEQRWSTIRLQQRTVQYLTIISCSFQSPNIRVHPCLFLLYSSQDFDEFGHRRPVMGRLPPPSYAQATGAVDLSSSSRTISSPGTCVPSQRQRQSNRVRRPAPPLPEPPMPLPLRLSTSGPSSVEVELRAQLPPNDITDPLPQPSQPSSHLAAGSFLARLVRRVWRKDLSSNGGGGSGDGVSFSPSSPSSSSLPDAQGSIAQDLHINSGSGATNTSRTAYHLSAFIAPNRRSDDIDDAGDDDEDDVDTEPLIESHSP